MSHRWQKKRTHWVNFHSKWTSRVFTASPLPPQRQKWLNGTCGGASSKRSCAVCVASYNVGLRLYGNTTEHKPHRCKLPIARRRARQNDLHFRLHLAAITFVPQANRTTVPFVSGARPPLQGTHAPVVLIHVHFGSLDSDHPGQNRTGKKTAPEDRVYYLAGSGAMSKLNKATVSLLFDFLSCAPFNLDKTSGIY